MDEVGLVCAMSGDHSDHIAHHSQSGTDSNSESRIPIKVDTETALTGCQCTSQCPDHNNDWRIPLCPCPLTDNRCVTSLIPAVLG